MSVRHGRARAKYTVEAYMNAVESELLMHREFCVEDDYTFLVICDEARERAARWWEKQLENADSEQMYVKRKDGKTIVQLALPPPVYIGRGMVACLRSVCR